MTLFEYPDREMMMIDLANKLAGELKTCLTTQDCASFAVPGGTTPGPVFDALCAADIDWSRVHVMLTDERWVPETHPRSNTRLVRKRLLVERAAAAKLVSIHTVDDAPDDRVQELSEAVRAELPISVMLLGMGGRGTCASLLPDADRLAEAMAEGAPPLMALRAPGAEEPRVTMTLPVIRGAMSLHLLITGPEKRETLERARRADPMAMPVAAILSAATVHWAE